MKSFAVVFLVLLISVAVQSYSLSGSRLSSRNVITSKMVNSWTLKMSDSEAPEVAESTAAFVTPDPEESDRKLFDMNRRVRLGRSRDQDGKSNIWSIEPTMEVVEEEGGGDTLKKNLVVGGAVIGVAIAVLPLFSAFSTLFPDPSDF